MKKIFVLVLVALFLVVVGCGGQEAQLNLEDASIEELNLGTNNKGDSGDISEQPRPYLEKIENYFNAEEAQIGETIGDMTVSSIMFIDTAPENFQAIISFTGETTVSGQYIHYENHEILGNNVIFVVDEESLSVLPQLEQDERYIWFSFSNQSEAKELFGEPGSKGTATIVIDNYQINFAKDYDYGNLATLVEVVEKK